MQDRPEPAASEPRPVIFEMPVTVTDEHVDAPGHHVNNVVYLQWVQQVAIAHWSSAAPREMQEALVWFVTRHEIDYLKEVFVGERLVVRTHVGPAKGARFDRFVEIVREGGEPVCRARSTWAAIDVKSGRPTRITPEMRAPFLR